ncbi:hypothetical protein DT076_17140 [Desertihabitans brevis]|uniref:DUF4157 domain-containing protein n=2 Tax=Desertihabitans brevis TaxID=2268447 RepID=A0A367YR61_9ACTN|nr:hypothetical protein DT076_17140 [Desertihabitans brevis]
MNLSTPLGLLISRVGGCRVRRGPRRLWLAEGYRPPFPVAPAFTVGDVLISRGPWDRVPASLLGHEERHSWQWFVCLGLPFLAVYGAAMAWSWLRTGDRGSANVFERDAGLVTGGYPERPLRPLFGGGPVGGRRLSAPTRPRARSRSGR